MALGDILSGYLDQAEKHHQTVMGMEYQRRSELAKQYVDLAQSDKYPEEARQEFLKRGMTLPSMDMSQKIPKEWENMTVQVQPPAPPPIKAPAQPGDTGPTAGMMPQGQQELPQAGVSAQTLQPPTPPPQEQSAFAPLSFAQNLDRQRQQEQMKYQTATAPLEILKMSKPVPTGVKGVKTDAQGNTFMSQQMRYMDPDTQKWQTFDQTSDTPLRHFAPRQGGELNIEDALALQKQDPSMVFMDEGTKQPIDLAAKAAAMPDATLRHTGSNEYQLNSQKYRLGTFNNQVVPIPQVTPSGGPTAANVGQPLGQSRPDINRTNWRPVGVDAQGFQIFEPFDSATRIVTGPRVSIPPGFAPPSQSPSGDMAPTAPPSSGGSAAPVKTPAANQPTPPPVGGNNQQPLAPNQRRGGLAPGAQAKTAEVLRSVRPAAQILYGDAKNPDFESIQSFAKIADDPERRDLVGGAVRTILEKLGQGGTMAPEVALGAMGTHASSGGIMTLLTNYLGLPASQAKSETQVVEDAIKPLKPEELRMVGRIMAAYGTIVGMRKITSGGAYQFSTEAMERELPIPGMTGVNSSQSYYNKLTQLSEELTSATRELPRNMVPEFPSWERNTAFLNAKGRGWGIAQNKQTGDYSFRHEDGAWYDQQGKPIGK